MNRSQSWSHFFLVGIFLLIATGAVAWLLVGRLSLFQTGNRVDLDFGQTRQLLLQQVLWMSAGSRIEQDFLAKYPGLYRIDLFLARSGELAQPVTLAFHLRDSCDSQVDLRSVTTTISSADIGDEAFSFSFAPVEETASRRFCFILEPISLPEQGHAVGVWVSRDSVYAAGQASYQAPPTEVMPTPTRAAPVDQPASAFGNKIFLPLILGNYPQPTYDNIDVGFQLHYSGRPLETVMTFFSYLVEDKRYFWSDPGFYVLLFAAYLVGVFLLSRIKPN